MEETTSTNQSEKLTQEISTTALTILNLTDIQTETPQTTLLNAKRYSIETKQQEVINKTLSSRPESLDPSESTSHSEVQSNLHDRSTNTTTTRPKTLPVTTLTPTQSHHSTSLHSTRHVRSSSDVVTVSCRSSKVKGHCNKISNINDEIIYKAEGFVSRVVDANNNLINSGTHLNLNDVSCNTTMGICQGEEGILDSKNNSQHPGKHNDSRSLGNCNDDKSLSVCKSIMTCCDRDVVENIMADVKKPKLAATTTTESKKHGHRRHQSCVAKTTTSSLLTFITSYNFHTCADLDRENAHFSFAESLLGRIEEMRWLQCVKLHETNDRSNDGNPPVNAVHKGSIRKKEIEDRKPLNKCSVSMPKFHNKEVKHDDDLFISNTFNSALDGEQTRNRLRSKLEPELNPDEMKKLREHLRNIVDDGVCQRRIIQNDDYNDDNNEVVVIDQSVNDFDWLKRGLEDMEDGDGGSLVGENGDVNNEDVVDDTSDCNQKDNGHFGDSFESDRTMGFSISSKEMTLAYHDASMLEDSRTSSSSVASFYSDADLIQQYDSTLSLNSYSTASLSTNQSSCGRGLKTSADVIAINLIRHFTSQLPPSSSQFNWLVSDTDTPQKMLPLPNSFQASLDHLLTKTKDKLRGTDVWAPPRPQIISTVPKKLPPKEMLQLQKNRCAGCGSAVELSLLRRYTRCEYTGKLFCSCCTSPSRSLIPGHILTSWSFKLHRVSHFASDFLSSNTHEPWFNIPKELYPRVKLLRECCSCRKQLHFISHFIKTCNSPERPSELLRNCPAHWFNSLHTIDSYSIDELLSVKNKELSTKLKKHLNICLDHINKCYWCKSRGHICEFCKSNNLIFPFQTASVTTCLKCTGSFHKKCYNENNCPKCKRLTERGKTAEGEKNNLTSKIKKSLFKKN